MTRKTVVSTVCVWAVFLMFVGGLSSCEAETPPSTQPAATQPAVTQPGSVSSSGETAPAPSDLPAEGQPDVPKVEHYTLDPEEIPNLLAQAERLQKEGNYKDAWEIYQRLALAGNVTDRTCVDVYTKAVQCLRNLDALNQWGDFREKAVAVHSEDWRVLSAVADSYMKGPHHGYLVAGEFHRGSHRGGGQWVNSLERDRARALQLFYQAIGHLGNEKSDAAATELFLPFANALSWSSDAGHAWRMQLLTDLSDLPDYSSHYPQRTTRGAPVDENGNPVFFPIPESFAAAESDGQRWRWCLQQAKRAEPKRGDEVDRRYADFLRGQFGVQTMRDYGDFFGRSGEADDAPAETGTWELHTLSDEETIAKLAGGVRRFALPEEHNYIRMYKELQAWSELAELYENRRQYPRAAEMWRKEIARNDYNNYRQRLHQVIGNWGRFEPVMTQPAGRGATVQYRFRNAERVELTAHAIKIETLLADVKAYLKTQPRELDWEQMRIEGIGYRLVHESQEKYIGEEVASWSLDLQPRAAHFDKRITVQTPLQNAGAYLLTAKLPASDAGAGNVSRIVLWLADTVLLKKPLDKGHWVFVGDADTGAPIAKANVEFFGWKWHRFRVGPLDHRQVVTNQFAEFTDAQGQVILTPKQADDDYSWLMVARTDDGRLAYLGFDRLWYPSYGRGQYQRDHPFLMTDRPVYRPGDVVKFKAWINRAEYDREGDSPYAGKSFTVGVVDPRGERLYEQAFQADQYGGLAGEMTLPAEATLGNYALQVRHGKGNYENLSWAGGNSFRVEEYKKPEFEVSVEAPAEPITLGETVEAKIVAKYYFGAPVANGRVKYKVMRSEADDSWFPPHPWDWLFGKGFWWFGYRYDWYPGWQHWGCMPPVWDWWGWRPSPQPELVAEAEVPLDEDGTLTIKIDSSLAKAIWPDRNHRYSITAEVTDESRRTIVGTGEVLVAKQPFKVYAWVDRGFYHVGDTVEASFAARRMDGKGVQGDGVLKLLKIEYKQDGQGRDKPVETELQRWGLATDAQGRSEQKLKADQPGQYRLSYILTDAKGHDIEGGYLFTVWGRDDADAEFRFNALELLPDRKTYQPGQDVNLRINTNSRDSHVWLFARPVGGVYPKPTLLTLAGRSTDQTIPIARADMPNFFVEAVTVRNGKVHTQLRQIAVPPEDRALQVEVAPAGEKTEYKPGEKAKLRIRLRDASGEPFVGSAVVTMYDKAVEYISGGSNVPDIVKTFWDWKRHHHLRGENTLQKGSSNLLKPDETAMNNLGVFGDSTADDPGLAGRGDDVTPASEFRVKSVNAVGLFAEADAAPMAAQAMPRRSDKADAEPESAGGELVEATVRTKFADTALWVANLTTDETGRADVDLTMPENLTTWTTKVWAMGAGTRVGQAQTELITTKNLIVRLQAPRFFVQTDEVVLSANVHNYLDSAKSAEVSLVLEGGTLELLDAQSATRTVEISAGGEHRVDWRVRAIAEGEAKITAKALTDEESDAMAMSFPVKVHGMRKTESFSGVLRPEQAEATITFVVPAERRPEQSRFELRYSPTLAGAMLDALPYLIEYPYGCTEQTLNRFVPTVITQKVLLETGVDLAAIQEKITNLNAQEIGDDVKRAEDWKRLVREKRWTGERWADRSPVYSRDELTKMVRAGVQRLTNMQNADGGWGWFSSRGGNSYPHTTAVVVHGLQVAKANDVAIVPDVLQRGQDWLWSYQQRQLQELQRWDETKKNGKRYCDNLDAMVFSVLVEAGRVDDAMQQELYKDRLKLSVYAMAMVGVAMDEIGATEQRDMLRRNVEQYLRQDEENQTAWLELPNQHYWWYWYGSEIEAHAWYLKLLARVEPDGQTAGRLVKYLLNNRRHATYWNSTRDTAYVIEAFADFLRASGEAEPTMTLEILLDREPVKTVTINKDNLFTFDNSLVLEGDALSDGEHTIAVRRTGDGPVYYNAYLTNFTLEDPIDKAGLEIKVRRRYFHLVRDENTTAAVEGGHGQAVRQRVEKYKRIEIPDPFAGDAQPIAGGELIEIELVIESKNDYEYIMFEDPKAAGLEPVEVRSGYGGNEMGAYMELRDDRVSFFVRQLMRGTHSLRYRMRAEIPGRFSALPTKAEAMYAPELRANSNEMKIVIHERPVVPK